MITDDESKKEQRDRIDVVGKQHSLEEELAAQTGTQAVAAFVLTDVSTPMYIQRKGGVERDASRGLWVLTEEGERHYPEGLLPDEKKKDASQASTTYARVSSMYDMLEAKSKRLEEPRIKIIVMHVNAIDKRKKADKKEGYVDSTAVQEWIDAYPKNLIFVQISEEDYEEYKASAPGGHSVAASYYYRGEDYKFRCADVAATQMSNTSAASPWAFSEEEQQVKMRIDRCVNPLLHKYGLPRMQDLLEHQFSEQARSAAGSRIAGGFFEPAASTSSTASVSPSPEESESAPQAAESLGFG